MQNRTNARKTLGSIVSIAIVLGVLALTPSTADAQCANCLESAGGCPNNTFYIYPGGDWDNPILEAYCQEREWPGQTCYEYMSTNFNLCPSALSERISRVSEAVLRRDVTSLARLIQRDAKIRLNLRDRSIHIDGCDARVARTFELQPSDMARLERLVAYSGRQASR